MLQRLGEHIAAAKERARLCGARALTVTDETLRRDLRDLEKAWLDLARSFETLKSMETFLLDSTKAKGIDDAIAESDTAHSTQKKAGHGAAPWVRA